MEKSKEISKFSYSASPPGEEPVVVGPSADLVDKETATETGGRGFNLIEMTQYFDVPESEEEKKLPKNYSDVIELLVYLGDNLDQSNEESLANFSDFLIKKFSEANDKNYTELFNNLMIKINNADLVNTNDILKKLAKIYSRTLSLEFLKNNNLEKSKKSAYIKTLNRAEQYISEV